MKCCLLDWGFLWLDNAVMMTNTALVAVKFTIVFANRHLVLNNEYARCHQKSRHLIAIRANGNDWFVAVDMPNRF